MFLIVFILLHLLNQHLKVEGNQLSYLLISLGQNVNIFNFFYQTVHLNCIEINGYIFFAILLNQTILFSQIF